MARLTQFFVYILSSRSRTLYVGVTSDLQLRVEQHRTKVFGGFTARYNIDQLVYYEMAGSTRAAFEREKQLKHWVRSKKIALIDSMNPRWIDLSSEWRMEARDPSTSLRMTDEALRMTEHHARRSPSGGRMDARDPSTSLRMTESGLRMTEHLAQLSPSGGRMDARDPSTSLRMTESGLRMTEHLRANESVLNQIFDGGRDGGWSVNDGTV